MFGCPLCTKSGILLFGIGFGMIFLVILHILPNPTFTWLGIGFIISAYIIPNVLKVYSCNDGSCSTKGLSEKK